MSYAAGIGALAGPLHGLANQEVLGWIKVRRNMHRPFQPSAREDPVVAKTHFPRVARQCLTFS